MTTREFCDQCGDPIQGQHVKIREQRMHLLAPSGDDRYSHFCRPCWESILGSGLDEPATHAENASLTPTLTECLFRLSLPRFALTILLLFLLMDGFGPLYTAFGIDVAWLLIGVTVFWLFGAIGAANGGRFRLSTNQS